MREFFIPKPLSSFLRGRGVSAEVGPVDPHAVEHDRHLARERDTRLLEAGAIVTTTTYDLASRPTQISDSAGHSLTSAFDTAKRVISVTQAAPNFSGTRVVGYQYDAASNKTRTTWADGYYVCVFR